VPVVDDRSHDRIDRQNSQELDPEDYDRVFEANGTDGETVDQRIESAAEEAQKLSSLQPQA